MITIQEPFFFRLTFTSVSKNYNFSFWHIYIQVYSFEYRFTTSIIFCNSCILSLNKTMSSAYIRRYKFNILSSWDLQFCLINSTSISLTYNEYKRGDRDCYERMKGKDGISCTKAWTKAKLFICENSVLFSPFQQSFI